MRIFGLIFFIIHLWGLAAHGALKPSCLRILENLSSAPRMSIGLFEGVRELRPTQFDYGLPRVRYLQKKLAAMSFEEVQHYLDQHPIPVVIGPNGDYFMVDRHHTLRALAESQEVLIENFSSKANELVLKLVVLEDKSNLNEGEFYRQMLEESLLYPYRKSNLMDVEHLPKQVLDLQKDYFRGLVWLLKKAQVIDENKIPFSDFIWASKLREIKHTDETVWTKNQVRSHLENFFDNYEKFRDLPGYKDERLSLDDIMESIEDYLP